MERRAALGDRIVLGLYHARPVHALPFLFGAVLVVVALRLRRQAPDTTAANSRCVTTKGSDK